MQALSFKEVCDFQSSLGNQIAKVIYELANYPKFKPHFTSLLERKHNTVTEDCPLKGLSIYESSDEEVSFNLNGSYYFNIKDPSIITEPKLLEIVLEMGLNLDTIIFPFEGYEKYFVPFTALYVKLAPTYDEYLKSLNSKHRNKVLSLDRKSGGVTYTISDTPNDEGLLYNLENASKHNEEDLDCSMYYKSQILYTTALKLSGYDKCWFQTIYDEEKKVIGYSSVIYDEVQKELLHYSNCSERNLGSYSINNFIKFFCGTEYELLNLVSYPEYPWNDANDCSVNGYKRPLSNLKVTRKSITSLDDASESSTPPYYDLEKHKWIL